jgi:hypothetical protein
LLAPSSSSAAHSPRDGRSIPACRGGVSQLGSQGFVRKTQRNAGRTPFERRDAS